MSTDAFAQAVELLHGALAQLQARGATLTASNAAVQALKAGGKPVVKKVASGAEPVEAERPRLKVKVEVTAKVPPVPAVRAVPSVPVLPKLPPLPTGPVVKPRKSVRLAALRDSLKATRTPAATPCGEVVFGSGNPEAELVFVHGVPSAEEREGGPYASPSGDLLGKIVEAMGFKRDAVYHVHILPGHPEAGEGRTEVLSAKEKATAAHCLREQLAILQPGVLVSLGGTALEELLGAGTALTKVRGKWQGYEGLALLPTVHPQQLVENPALLEKRKLWEDMLLVLKRLGRLVTAKQQGYFLTGR